MRSTRLFVTATIALAVVLVALGSAAAPGHDSDSHTALAARSVVRDLSPATSDPTDGVHSHVQVKVWRTASEVSLQLSGFAKADAGRSFGAHLHLGPCVSGDGAAAGPHYNADAVRGAPSPEVSRRTEVWLDFTVRRNGTASSRARVPFSVQPGDHAVVVHALTTAPDGTAGARLACLPVVW